MGENLTRSHEAYASEERDDAWASAKEASIAEYYPIVADVARAELVSVDCRREICWILSDLVIEPGRPDWGWEMRSALEDTFLRNEDCAFYLPAFDSVVATSCNRFEFSAYVGCSR